MSKEAHCLQEWQNQTQSIKTFLKVYRYRYRYWTEIVSETQSEKSEKLHNH